MGWLDDNRPWLARARERWSPRTAEPLTLRVWFASPVAWDSYDGITIEGAIQHAVVARETRQMPDEVFAGCPRDLSVEEDDIAIPIADEVMGGQRIACASWGQPAHGAAETVRMRRKRTRVDLFPGDGKLNISGGNLKILNTTLPTLTVSYLDFHVRGDRERLADILQDVGAIGRFRSAGVGRVAGTEILPDPEGRSLVWRRRPMRTLPAEANGRYAPGTYDLREATTRAPYWHQRSKTLCVVPILRIGEEEAA